MTLRVLLDATAIPAQRVGVGWYVTGLVDAFAREEEVELHVVAKHRDAEDFRVTAPGTVVHEAAARSRPVRLLWEQTALPLRTRRLAPDVYHGPHYTLPRSPGCPAVVTFHDPTFFTRPELHERAKVSYFSRMAKAGAKRADRVIAVSRYARDGVIEHADVDADKVDVVHLGLDTARYTADEGTGDGMLRHRIGADGPYILWVGALEPRKDVPTLVDAFAALARDGIEHRLVLVGPPAWGAAAISETIERSGASDRILRTGYVSEEEKVALLRGAEMFVYPSIAEGFGLPVLEAMACGTPVVTTTGSAPEEIADGAAELVPPADPALLGKAIAGLLSDAGRREDLRRRGLERANAFSWERTARETIAVYRRALGR